MKVLCYFLCEVLMKQPASKTALHVNVFHGIWNLGQRQSKWNSPPLKLLWHLNCGAIVTYFPSCIFCLILCLRYGFITVQLCAVLWRPHLDEFIAIPQWYLGLKAVNVGWHRDITHLLSMPNKMGGKKPHSLCLVYAALLSDFRWIC